MDNIMVPYWCLSKSSINLHTQTCLDNRQESASFPHTHTFQKKGWFRGAKSPRRNPAQKPLKSRTRDHQKAQGQQQSARGRGHGLAWRGSPLFFSSKKNGLRVPSSREAGSNGRYDEFAIAVYRGSRCKSKYKSSWTIILGDVVPGDTCTIAFTTRSMNVCKLKYININLDVLKMSAAPPLEVEKNVVAPGWGRIGSDPGVFDCSIPPHKKGGGVQFPKIDDLLYLFVPCFFCLVFSDLR